MTYAKTIKAAELKKDDIIIKENGSLYQVKEVDKLSGKAITFRTRRLTPDFYDGDFFNRKLLITNIIILTL